jgi:Ca2+-binding EF-hand superfamily protein
MYQLWVVSDLVQEIDPNHDGKIMFDEFCTVMKHIEQRMTENSRRNSIMRKSS